MYKSSYKKDIIATIAMIGGSIMLEGLALILLQIFARPIMSSVVNICTIAIAVFLGSILYPYVFLHNTYMVSFSDVGIKKPTVITYAILLVSITLLYFVLSRTGLTDRIILIIVQNVFVAIGEEFVSRGCLYYMLKKVFRNELVIAVVATLVFVFAFHSNASFVENIIWRLPITILLVFIYLKTKSILNCSIIHMTYNVIVSI